jgi:hypothetical protein
MNLAIAKPRTRLRRWDLRKLGAEQLDALLLRAYRLEQRLFTSMEPFELYAGRIRGSDAKHKWLWTFEDAQLDLVGYNYVFLYSLEKDGRCIDVLRSNAGLLPAWRRHNRIVGAGLAPCFLQRILRPRASLYLHLWLSHPSGYASVDKYFDVLWPSPRTDPQTPAALDIARYLNEQFGARCADPSDPFLVESATAVDDPADETRSWTESTRPSVQYFLERNPAYRRGKALTIIVPVTMATLATLAGRLVFSRIQKKLSEGARSRQSRSQPASPAVEAAVQRVELDLGPGELFDRAAQLELGLAQPRPNGALRHAEHLGQLAGGQLLPVEQLEQRLRLERQPP